jgi:hypothetical protein
MIRTSLTSAVAVVAALGVASGAAAINRRSYIAKNLAMLRAVPAYPGARLKRIDESGYRANGLPGAKIVGYGTTRVYVLSRSVKPRSVIAFYGRALRPRWHLLQTYRSRGFGQLNFRRGNAYLEVFATPGEVDVEIDHDCYKGHRTPVCFGP